ncbi:MAG: 30S ribosomal protein S17 [Deltaproteobacteria bacterium]|nr:30S ribosomal protein S17 [Deltaproteobacteria bacterium]HCH63697.1 30S ribosomal protein S17 [Deltaproteobacteria bacterium]
MSEPSVSSGKRELVGRVVSAKMDKTVVVEVVRRVKHPRYRKYVNRRKTYKAHDEKNEFSLNDRVVIRESRPLSRTKRWVVTGVAEVR